MHPLIRMHVMLDFICVIFVKLWVTGSKRKVQNQNIYLRRESNQRPFICSQACRFKHWAIGTVNDMF